jgi:hypothetical protein
MTVSPMHSALPEFEEELEGEYEGEEFDLGGVISGLLGEGEFEDEAEGEYELEGEWEDEYEDESEGMANPLRRVYPDAMMEHLGHAAAEAETEAEAEAFIGALVPLAAGLARSAAPHLARSAPHLVRGLSKVTRTLRRNPTTRQLVRVLPTVASRTTHSLARQAARGRPITPHQAVRTLAGQTAAVLRSPRTRNHVVRRARALDRRYHRGGQWWTGGLPTGSAPGVRARAPRRTTQSALAPVRYGAQPARYRTQPVRYGAQPVRYGAQPVRYGTPVTYGTPVRRGTPASYGTSARAGTPVRRVPGQRTRGRGYPRQRRYPAGLSIAWVPVPAWRGSQPPPGAYRS